MSRFGLERLSGTTEQAARLRGVYVAIVTANLDEGSDSRHRVKVRFPWLPNDDESYWDARQPTASVKVRCSAELSAPTPTT